MLFRVCILIVSYFLLVSSLGNFENNARFNKTPKFEKLPMDVDLFKYLESLRRITKFFSNHNNDIDINFYFGLFLANVNLKRAFQKKHYSLSRDLKIYLKGIIQNSDELLNYFQYMIRQDHDPQSNKYKTIFSLFENTTIWIYRLRNFHLQPVNEAVSHYDLEKVFTNWTFYTKNIDDVNKWLPTPKYSDKCLVSLATATLTYYGTTRICRVSEQCYEMIQNGTDFGYALGHRLLFLQQARYGRGCSIFSEQEDKEIGQRFCSIAYKEAEYIAWHDFEIVDLLLEHVSLCALDGHAHFLRRSWLENIIRFQTVPGCFSQHVPKPLEIFKSSMSNIWRVAKTRDHDILGGYCNGHTTALAASTLAIASRFIIETYY